MNGVLCFSGGIASGKTTLSTAVAERLGVRRTSFGGLVRDAAKERDIDSSRESLQALGESLIAEMGWDAFCTAVLHAAGWSPGIPLVLDGIRHTIAFETVKKLVAPMPAVLVFVDVGRDVRRGRRDGTNVVDLAKADAHSTEQEVHSGALRSLATVVLDGTKGVDDLVEDVLRAVR